MPNNALVLSICEGYEKVRAKIAEVAQSARRDPDSIKLITVTKKQPISVIEAAVDAGIKIFGENYPEEAVKKMQSLGEENTVEWHMIGHVQSRKARLVAENFALMHSLDSIKLARRLDRFSAEFGRKSPVLLELNVSGESSKHGWNASDEARWEELFPDIEEILLLENLEVRGLMTMPPFFQDSELVRPYFRQLRNLRDMLSARYPQYKWEELSMGTSGDFHIAVEEGATIIRVGRAILGTRPI